MSNVRTGVVTGYESCNDSDDDFTNSEVRIIKGSDAEMVLVVQ